MASNQVIIDLSSSSGLAPRFFGNYDQTTTLPNRSYFKDTSALAEGFFNPWMRDGFLSPAVATLGATTTDNAFAATLTSCVYDDINDDLYFAESGNQLFRLDGLDDTSFEREYNLPGTTGSPTFVDLEIYQINGVRYLLGSYSRSADTFTADAGTDYITFTNGWATDGVAVTLTNFGGSLPGGLSAGVTYYLVNTAGPTAQLSTSLGGAAINLTSSGSGTNTAKGSLGNIFGKNLSTSSTTERVLSTVTNPLAPVSSRQLLRVADNGFLYILDGSAVHKFDGTTSGGTYGTVTANSLVFPPYFNIVDGIDYRGLMFLAVHQSTIAATSAHSDSKNFSTACGIYVWDRFSSILQTRDYLPLQGVKAIRKVYISPGGALRIVCIASNGITQIREYGGNNFQVIKELGLGASPQYPDSLTTSAQHTIWLGNDGTIYCHGSINVGEQEVLAKLGYVKAPSTSPSTNLDATGAIFYGAASSFSGSSGYRIDRQGLTIAYNNGGSYLAKKFFPFDKGTINDNNQLALAGNIYTGLNFLPQLSTVGYMDVFMATGVSTGTTTQANMSIYINGSSTALMTKAITRDDISRGYKRIEINKPYVNSIQLKIAYDTSILLSDNWDFHPSYAVVSITPTQTKG